MPCTKCLWGGVAKQLRHPPIPHFVLILSFFGPTFGHRQDSSPHRPSTLLLRGRTNCLQEMGAWLCSVIGKQSYISTRMNSQYIVSQLHVSRSHPLRQLQYVKWQKEPPAQLKWFSLCIERNTYRVFIILMRDIKINLLLSLVPPLQRLSGQSALRTCLFIGCVTYTVCIH